MLMKISSKLRRAFLVVLGLVVFCVHVHAAGALLFNCLPGYGPTVQGASYSTTCTASGGTAPYTFSTSGLPAGLATTGTTATTTTVGGAASGTGAYSFSVSVKDSGSPQQNTTFSFIGTIYPPLVLSCSSPPVEVVVGAAISVPCTASGGNSPYNWSASGVPPGLSLSSATGTTVTLSGNATTAGVYNFTLNLTDSTPRTAQTGAMTFNLTVVAPLTVNCAPASGPADVGAAYSATCTASGGTAPYGWSVGSGALPAGVTLSAAAGASINVSGAPTTAGAYTYSIKVTDSTTPTAQTAGQSYSGTISTAVTVSTASLPMIAR